MIFASSRPVAIHLDRAFDGGDGDELRAFEVSFRRSQPRRCRDGACSRRRSEPARGNLVLDLERRGWRATHKHVLEVEGSGEKLSARERFDDEEPVKVTDLKLTDKKVSFSVSREKRQASYSGTLKSADLIEGLVNTSTGGQTSEFGWEARREATKKK